MLTADDVVVLLDFDNTLFDNDRFAADLGAQLTQAFGAVECERYWTIYAERRAALGYADYLAALQTLRVGRDNDPKQLQISTFMLEYPFAERLFPRALDVIAHLRSLGLPGVLSDGDVVFQPWKIQRSGIWEAVGGRVHVYLHKERMLAAIRRHLPARHYVLVDDKPQLLAAMKRTLGREVTTVFVRQGHFAAESADTAIDPGPDLSVDLIADLLNHDRTHFLKDAR